MIRIRMIKPIGTYIDPPLSRWRTWDTRLKRHTSSTGWQTESVPDAVKFPYADRHVQHPQGAWNGRPYIDKTDPGCAPGTGGGYYRASGGLLDLRRARRAGRNARFRSRL